MESVNAWGTIDEEVLQYYFPEFKENINAVTCNKYVIIDRKKKQTKKDGSRQQQKGRATKMEWFENLEIQQRIEAISTIASENTSLVASIKNDIKKLEEKYSRTEEKCIECTSNQEQINVNLWSDADKSFDTQNWHVSLSSEYPEWVHNIIQNLTFLDFNTSEDTISAHEDLVLDSNNFFLTLEKSWEELQKMEYKIQNWDPNTMEKLNDQNWGDNIDIEEMMLCGKILCLIEIALNSTYSRSMNDKRNYYQKSYVESHQALWNLNKEIMTENLLLNEEILAFLIESIKDIDRAYEYQIQNNIFIKDDKNTLKSQEGQIVEITNNDIINDIVRHIQHYRTQLVSLICPTKDSEHEYEITKSQDQLYDIIDKARLYKNGQYDEKTRYFARYFYNNLINKSREVMTERLIQGESLDLNAESKDGAKGSKKGAKAKRRKRNKTKMTPPTKEEPNIQSN